MPTDLKSSDILTLAVGVILGLAVVLFIRSRQVAQPGLLGYDRPVNRRAGWLAAWAWVAVVSVAGIGVLYVWSSMRPNPSFVAEPTTVEIEAQPRIKLIIPQLGVEAEMIEAPFVARQWDISRLTDEVAHLAGTAYPGERGNAVLAGHITIPGGGWGPFRELDRLRPGDHIFIERGEEVLIYEVVELKTVDRRAVEITFPTEDERLTLITCSGWSDELDDYTARIVVVALLVQDS